MQVLFSGCETVWYVSQSKICADGSLRNKVIFYISCQEVRKHFSQLSFTLYVCKYSNSVNYFKISLIWSNQVSWANLIIYGRGFNSWLFNTFFCILYCKLLFLYVWECLIINKKAFSLQLKTLNVAILPKIRKCV